MYTLLTSLFLVGTWMTKFCWERVTLTCVGELYRQPCPGVGSAVSAVRMFSESDSDTQAILVGSV